MRPIFAAVAACLFWVVSATAMAGGSVRVGFITDAQFDDEFGLDADGDGFTLKATVDFTDNVFGFAGILSREYENVVDLQQTRVGVGVKGFANNVAYWGGLNFELATIEAGSEESDANGVALRGGVSIALSSAVILYSELGLIALEDDNEVETTGVDAAIGLAIKASDNVGVFVDYRHQALEEDAFGSSYDFDIKDLSLGLALFF